MFASIAEGDDFDCAVSQLNQAFSLQKHSASRVSANLGIKPYKTVKISSFDRLSTFIGFV